MPIEEQLQTFGATLNDISKALEKDETVSSENELITKIQYKKAEKLKKFRDKISYALGDNVGKQTTNDEIKRMEAAGGVRYDKKIAPGFNDDDKSDDSIRGFQGIDDKNEIKGPIYQRKYGDVLNWPLLLDYLRNNKDKLGFERIILVTNDGTSGKKNALLDEDGNPRIELRTELWAETQANLYIVNNSKFLEDISVNANFQTDSDMKIETNLMNDNINPIRDKIEESQNYLDEISFSFSTNEVSRFENLTSIMGKLDDVERLARHALDFMDEWNSEFIDTGYLFTICERLMALLNDLRILSSELYEKTSSSQTDLYLGDAHRRVSHMYRKVKKLRNALVHTVFDIEGETQKEEVKNLFERVLRDTAWVRNDLRFISRS